MTKLFNRKVSLIIGDRDGSNNVTGFRLRNSHIAFDIKKDDKQTANSGIIKVYNLSESTRNEIDRDKVIILNTGYEEIPEKLLFDGEVTRVIHREEGADIITEIECKDSIVALRGTLASLNFAENTSGLHIISQLAKELNVENASIIQSELNRAGINDIAYKNGYSFIGSVRSALNKITERFNLEWSIQNHKLVVVKKEGTSTIDIVKLSKTSGMIGSPEPLSDIDNKTKKSKASKNGFVINSLIMPELEPTGRVQVESSLQVNGKAFDGIFRINRVNHKGSNFNDEWRSITEIQNINETS